MTRTLEGPLSVDKLQIEAALTRDSEVMDGDQGARKSPAAGKHRAEAGASQVLLPLGGWSKS